MKTNSATTTIGIDLGDPGAKPPQPAAQLPHDRVHGSLGALGNPDPPRRGEALAAVSTSPARHDMKPSTNRSPIMIEVLPARIP
jgi:hypothetical protein